MIRTLPISLLKLFLLYSGTGGPPLTRKSLTMFPLPQLLAYVRASGGFSGSRGL